METINKQEIEKRVIDTLLESGMTFEVPRKSIFGRSRTREINIYQPYLGTLDYLTREFLSIDFDEKKIQENPTYEAKHLVGRCVRTMARIVAIAVLNSRWKIKLFTGPLARYFLWRLTPSKLFHLSVLINMLNNTGDFTNSIRLMSGVSTTTPKADLVEKKQKPRD